MTWGWKESIYHTIHTLFHKGKYKDPWFT